MYLHDLNMPPNSPFRFAKHCCCCQRMKGTAKVHPAAPDIPIYVRSKHSHHTNRAVVLRASLATCLDCRLTLVFLSLQAHDSIMASLVPSHSSGATAASMSSKEASLFADDTSPSIHVFRRHEPIDWKCLILADWII